MIRYVFRQLGRHPKTCLIPVGMFAALTGAQLLAFRYGEVFAPSPFAVLAALWLILATLACLIVAVGWWIHDRLVRADDDRERRLIGHLDRLHAELVALRVALHHRQDPAATGLYERRPGWNANTVLTFGGGLYGQQRPALNNERVPSLEEQIEALEDPPTGEVRR